MQEIIAVLHRVDDPVRLARTQTMTRDEVLFQCRLMALLSAGLASRKR